MAEGSSGVGRIVARRLGDWMLSALVVATLEILSLRLEESGSWFCTALCAEANKLALKIYVKVLAVPHADNKDKNLTLFNYVSNTITA